MEEYIKPEKDEVFNGGIFYVLTEVAPSFKYEKVEITGSDFQKGLVKVKYCDTGKIDNFFLFDLLRKKVE